MKLQQGDLGVCMALADCMTHLMQLGVRMFLKNIEKYLSDSEIGRISKTREGLIKSADFKTMLDQTRLLVSEPGFVSHPKFEKLSDIVVAHFLDHQESVEATKLGGVGVSAPNDGDGGIGVSDTTRVMIFTSFRDTVDEIVNVLSTHQPLVRAMSFVGQGKKDGKGGLTQKEQLQVSELFFHLMMKWIL